jgi:diadenosine tetraphosphate (Ap4A) HIT family hydrolase
VVINDIKPATKHHYLVIPAEHMPDAKHVSCKDIPCIERMAQLGKMVLRQQGAPLDDMLLGFHWPPFQAIEHLHMHCLAPVSEMGYFNKKVTFRPDSWCFVTVEWLLDHLNDLKTGNNLREHVRTA